MNCKAILLAGAIGITGVQQTAQATTPQSVRSSDASAGPASAVTFSEDIARIIFTHCADCHRTGGAAPFSLLTYEEIRPWARQIAAVTQRRSMPPWAPEPEYGDFAGARRLNDQEISLIQQWVNAGALRGETSKWPPLPQWADGCQMGQPDLVIRI